MASCGCPYQRDDHAVVMSRFASDCVSMMKEVTSSLQESLGADTLDLALRVGIHVRTVTSLYTTRRFTLRPNDSCYFNSSSSLVPSQPGKFFKGTSAVAPLLKNSSCYSVTFVVSQCNPW